MLIKQQQTRISTEDLLTYCMRLNDGLPLWNIEVFNKYRIINKIIFILIIINDVDYIHFVHVSYYVLIMVQMVIHIQKSVCIESCISQ
ncbi:unnamed protein product [Paramecium sonneborni]|uniref:Uncharacterized protein n=1 Tax=Paramecium sonneborni TaxID=65129 RepID=A0A8S1RMW3_9CILI|nr:unnamed protein product [Paramecium sonneborni]